MTASSSASTPSPPPPAPPPSSSDSSPPPPPAAAPSPAPEPSSTMASFSPYPYAAAPDIIRAQQKDAYFAGALANQLADLHRRLLGARSAHAWAAEARTAADLLYLSLTTLVGSRTLGEEYCDLVQVEEIPRASASPPSSAPGSSDATVGVVVGPQLPTLARRAAYIASSVLAPYALSRALPAFRRAVRRRLEARLAELARQGKGPQKRRGFGTVSSSSSSSSSSSNSNTKGGGGERGTWDYRLTRYVLAHLGSLTSGTHLRAATLAAFYFTGAYYTLSKRLLGLRYVFTRRLAGEEDGGAPGAGPGGRAGYEVLGVLLVFQLAVQAYLHVRQTLSSSTMSEDEEEVEAAVRERLLLHPGAVEVSLDHEHTYTANNELLLDAASGAGPSDPYSSSSFSTGGGPGGSAGSRIDIAAATHTPVPRAPRHDLRHGAVMRWVRGAQQRRCTLCLEPLRDPAATQCGHVFCWACIGDWVREKPECPLCRRAALAQHILPLRVA